MVPVEVGVATDAQLTPRSVVLSGDGVEIPRNIVELVANLALGAVLAEEGQEERQEEEEQEAGQEEAPPTLVDVRSLAVFLTGR